MNQNREVPETVENGQDVAAAPALRPRQRVIVPLVFVSWVVQIASLVAICLWIFFDARFVELVRTSRLNVLVPYLADSTATSATALGPRVWILRLVALGVVLSFLGAIVGLAIGSRAQRRIVVWLAFTAIVAGWLSLFTAWDDLAWSGQKWRLTGQVDYFAPIADRLRADWPTEDGEFPDVGTFMAYPRESPRMLLIVAQPKQVGFVGFSSVERSPTGAIRFELAGGETGAWLEWHPGGDAPASFLGGLETNYHLERSASLGNHWYVTRYAARLNHIE